MDSFNREEEIKKLRMELDKEYQQKFTVAVQSVKETIADKIRSGATMEEWFANADFHLELERQAQQSMFNEPQQAEQVDQAQVQVQQQEVPVVAPIQVETVQEQPQQVQPELIKQETPEVVPTPVETVQVQPQEAESTSITPEMELAAFESSQIFAQGDIKPIVEQSIEEPQAEVSKPDFYVESNISKYSTMARNDDRLSLKSMHTEMVNKENAIHDEMKHGQDSKEFFDYRKPDQLNNYFEHSTSYSHDSLAMRNGKETREHVKGKSNEVQVNDSVYSDSLKFMTTSHNQEMDYAKKFNPNSVDMVEKKQSFEKIDFNLMDKANRNKIAQERLGDNTVSAEEKKNTAITPITAEEKQQWFTAYNDFNKERDAYKGVQSEKSYSEQKMSDRLENQMVNNYTNMMDKSYDKDFKFERKEVQSEKDYDKYLNNVSDIEKNKVHTSFKDYKADELGKTYKHEYKDKSIDSKVVEKKIEPTQAKNNGEKLEFSATDTYKFESMKLSDYSPALQNLIIKADKDMAKEYGTKEITKEATVARSPTVEKAQVKSMSAIQESNKQRFQNEKGRVETASMAAIKSQSQSSELKQPEQSIDIFKKKQIEAGAGL